MRLETKLWLWIGALVMLTPLGLLAMGTAWGEWSSEELLGRLGFIPRGVVRLASCWRALLPHYMWPGWNAGWRAAIGYIASAVIGIGVTALVLLGLGRLLTLGRRGPRH